MKIVIKSNYDEEIFQKQVVAENLNNLWANEFVELWNDKYWNDNSNIYLKVVEDNYVPYNGYDLLL